MLQPRSSAGGERRSNLLIRMHFLRMLCQPGASWMVPELRRRTRCQTTAPIRQARQVSCVGRTCLQPGRLRSGLGEWTEPSQALSPGFAQAVLKARSPGDPASRSRLIASASMSAVVVVVVVPIRDRDHDAAAQGSRQHGDCTDAHPTFQCLHLELHEATFAPCQSTWAASGS